MPKKIKLSGIHYHEAMDRCALFERMIYSELFDHAAVSQNRHIKDDIDKAIGHLSNAYQHLGEKRFEFKD